MTLACDRIKSITCPSGKWYRVGGTRTAPDFERIAVWAVVELYEINDDDLDSRYNYSDTVVGTTASEFSVSGLDPDAWMLGVAGYVELSDEELERVVEDPRRLPHHTLNWNE